MRTIIATIILMLPAATVVGQEQGYFTNGKERLRAEANWPSAGEQVGPTEQTSGKAARQRGRTGGMIGATDVNEPNVMALLQAQNNELREIVRQMDAQNKELALHQAQLEADLHSVHSMARDEGAARTADAVDRIILKEQQFGQERRQWRNQLYDQFGLGRYENTGRAAGQQGVPAGGQNTLQQDQRRRQSEQIGLESK